MIIVDEDGGYWEDGGYFDDAIASWDRRWQFDVCDVPMSPCGDYVGKLMHGDSLSEELRGRLGPTEVGYAQCSVCGEWLNVDWKHRMPEGSLVEEHYRDAHPEIFMELVLLERVVLR